MKAKKAALLFLALIVILFSAGNLIHVADAASSRVAVIKELSGTVHVKKSGGSKSFKAFSRMSLNEGDVLTTESNSTAVLQFSNGTSEDDKMSVSANTTLTFSKLSDRNGTKTKVSMFNGTAWIDVKSIATPNDEFTLETPTAIMGVRGTHLLVGVDPDTGSTRLTVAAGVVNATTAGNPETMDVLPNQDAVFTEDDEDVSIAPTDLTLLMTQSDSSIVEAILKAAGDIVKENVEKKDLYVQQSGMQSPEDQARLKSNVDNLLGAIVDQAVKSGLISGKRANALVAESQAQTGVSIDLSKKEITLSEAEKRKQEEQKNKADDAKKAADAQKKIEEEARKQNDALLKKLEEERQKKEEAIKQAEADKKAEAVKAYVSQLDESKKTAFTQEQQNRQQESSSTPTPTPSPTPSPSTYTVNFNSNGGTAVASQTVNEAGVVTSPAEPAKTGYVFAGWYRDSGLTQPFDLGTPITADTTLYAKWNINTYSLSYTAGANGTISGEALQSVNYGASGSAVTAVPDTGYHFMSWSDNVTTAARTDTNVTAELTVMAQFEPSTYTVSFESNGGSEVTSQAVHYGDTAELPTSPSRTNYTFAGWYTDSDLTQAYAFGTPIAGDTTLFAKWSIDTYLLQYSTDGNGIVSGSVTQNVYYGANGSTVTAVPITGYHFMNWSDGVTTAERTDTNVTADFTVTAMFAINTYTVNFNSNGGSAVASPIVNYNSEVVQPEEPTKAGYSFGGWYSDSGLTQSFDFETLITGETTLYAKWNFITYALQYTAGANGTIIGEASQSVYYGANGSTVTAVPITGYHFMNWSDGVMTAARTDTNVIADVTVTAEFEIDAYTVNFNSNGGSVVVSQTVNYNSSAVQPEEPTRASYVFGGWYSDSGLTQSFDFGTPIIGETMLYAKWQASNTLLNAGFESPSISNFQYNLAAPGWTFSGNYSGIEHNGSNFDAPDALEGNQAAILQMQGSFSQSVDFPAGIYNISFMAASRPGNQQFFDVLLDSTVIDSFETTLHEFLPFTTNSFAVTAGVHTLKFVGKTTEDRTSFIDDVRINILPAAEEVAAGITSVDALAANATSLSMPSVPPGFDIAIDSSSNEGVIGTNGAVATPQTNTNVNLVFRVTRILDNTSANTAPITVTVPSTLLSLAGGITPTTNSNSTQGLVNVTDENNGSWWDGGTGLVWLKLDLGASYYIQMVNLRHYWDGQQRSYHDVIVQLSNTADFSSGVTTIFNNDSDNSANQGVGTDEEYDETAAGKSIDFGPINARYVRLWSNGNSLNTSNHMTEVEVYGY